MAVFFFALLACTSTTSMALPTLHYAIQGGSSTTPITPGGGMTKPWWAIHRVQGWEKEPMYIDAADWLPSTTDFSNLPRTDNETTIRLPLYRVGQKSRHIR